MSSHAGRHFGTETWWHLTACGLPCWGAPGQTTNREGTQPHPPAVSLPKDFLNSESPLDTPLDAALPTRGPRRSSTHQWASTGPSHQEARHQKQESYDPAACKTKFTNTDQNLLWGDFPGGAVVKKPPANAGDTGSSLGPGRSHMPRNN